MRLAFAECLSRLAELSRHFLDMAHTLHCAAIAESAGDIAPLKSDLGSVLDGPERSSFVKIKFIAGSYDLELHELQVRV